MTNGYKIFWTDHALGELKATLDFLEAYWTDKELRNLALELEKTLRLISQNPFLFQSSDFRKGIRRVVVAKLNTMYYRINADSIEILSFFTNRQNPQKRKV